MNSSQRKKTALFNKFALNLECLKRYLNISIESSVKNASYICPLSFQIYNSDGLNNELSVEHAPPESLGGNKVALTAKNLNSESGHSIDIDLLNYIKVKSFNQGALPLETRFRIEKSFSVKGKILNKERPEFFFHASSFHYGLEKVKKLFESREKFNLTFSTPSVKNVDLAFLRIAYLIAFSELGYGFLLGGSRYINPNTYQIAEQLLNIKSRSIPPIPIIEEDFPDAFLGVNIIVEPEEFRSLLIVFDLNIQNVKYRYGVFLPGPDEYGFAVYNHLDKINIDRRKIKFNIYTFPDMIDLKTFEGSISYLELWRKFHGFTS